MTPHLRRWVAWAGLFALMTGFWVGVLYRSAPLGVVVTCGLLVVLLVTVQTER